MTELRTRSSPTSAIGTLSQIDRNLVDPNDGDVARSGTNSLG